MSASLEELGLPPRPNITVVTVNRETVRAIVNAERLLCHRAFQMEIDVDTAHSGYASYIDAIMQPLSESDKTDFQKLLVEETLNDERLDKARAGAAEAERRYAEALEQPKPLSTARIFFAGVNTAILIGIALYWAFK